MPEPIRAKLLAWSLLSGPEKFDAWFHPDKPGPDSPYRDAIEEGAHRHFHSALDEVLTRLYPDNPVAWNLLYGRLEGGIRWFKIATFDLIDLENSVSTWVSLRTTDLISESKSQESFANSLAAEIYAELLMRFRKQARRDKRMAEAWNHFLSITEIEDSRQTSSVSSSNNATPPDASSQITSSLKWIGLAAASGLIGATATKASARISRSTRIRWRRVTRRRSASYEFTGRAHAIAAGLQAIERTGCDITNLACQSAEELPTGGYRIVFTSTQCWATVEMLTAHHNDARVQIVSLPAHEA